MNGTSPVWGLTGSGHEIMEIVLKKTAHLARQAFDAAYNGEWSHTRRLSTSEKLNLPDISFSAMFAV